MAYAGRADGQRADGKAQHLFDQEAEAWLRAEKLERQVVADPK